VLYGSTSPHGYVLQQKRVESERGFCLIAVNSVRWKKNTWWKRGMGLLDVWLVATDRWSLDVAFAIV